MTEYPIFVFTALLILAYGLFSNTLEKSVITAPMVVVAIGLIASSFQIDVLRQGIHAPLVKILAELTLVLVLFNDASTINLTELRKERRLPIRLLLVGLPLATYDFGYCTYCFTQCFFTWNNCSTIFKNAWEVFTATRK